MVKLLKEHNELRYHRLTNVLSSLVKVTFEDTFLVKAHFLKHPGQVLLLGIDTLWTDLLDSLVWDYILNQPQVTEATNEQKIYLSD